MPLDRTRIGDLMIGKGCISDLQINIWDKVRRCKGKNCPLADVCPYEHANKEDPTCSCLVERKYLTANIGPFMELLTRVNDQFLMQWIGMHLIPLYLDLVQLKMAKLALDKESDGGIVYTDGKGQIRIHPIFDEIRKTHKEIFNMWRTTGLQKIAADAGFFKDGGKIIPDDDDIDTKLVGDASEYEDMASGL